MNQTSYGREGVYSEHKDARGPSRTSSGLICHTLVPSQITDIFYADFIQWAHEGGNCYSTIKLYCNLLKAALVWASRHGCILSQRYSDIVRISPENFERNMFRIIQKKTGNKAIVDIDKYAVVPRLTYKLLKKYNYRCPYTSNVSNYNRYLHDLLQLVGEEFNDTVITEVRTGGVICRNEYRKWELCTSRTGRRTFISYNVMRCPTEAEVRKCSGHKSMKTFERYITFDED